MDAAQVFEPGFRLLHSDVGLHEDDTVHPQVVEILDDPLFAQVKPLERLSSTPH